MFRRALRALLDLDPSFEVVGEAADGKRLLALIGDTPADVVLMDMAMPGLTGVEVLERLDEATRSRVIVLTAQASPSDLADATRLGAACVLLKDVDLEALHGAIRRLATGNRPRPCPIACAEAADPARGEARGL